MQKLRQTLAYGALIVLAGSLVAPISYADPSKCNDAEIRIYNKTSSALQIVSVDKGWGEIHVKKDKQGKVDDVLPSINGEAIYYVEADYRARTIFETKAYGTISLRENDCAKCQSVQVKYEFVGKVGAKCNAHGDVLQGQTSYKIDKKVVSAAQGYDTHVDFDIKDKAASKK